MGRLNASGEVDMIYDILSCLIRLNVREEAWYLLCSFLFFNAIQALTFFKRLIYEPS